MRLFRRGRHARAPKARFPAVIVVISGVAVGGSAFGISGALVPDTPAAMPTAPPVEATAAAVIPPIVPRTPSLAPGPTTPPPGAAELAAADTAWRDHEHAVSLRLEVVEADDVPLPPDSGEGRRIVYSNSEQRVWLVKEDGTVVHTTLVSGRRNTPRPDTYHVFSKSELAWAGHDGITMRYMVRYTWGETLPLGFHSIPVFPDGTPLQTAEDLGSFRSAGCTRQRLSDAIILYRFADIGTKVVVTP